MDEPRRLRPRRIFWQRFSAGLATATMAVGLLAVPSAAEGSGSGVRPASPVSPAATLFVVSRVVPSGQYTPPKIGVGDADFKGHGPKVTASASLNGAFAGSTTLSVTVCMHAKETRSDHTEAGGCDDTPATIFGTPQGQCIQSVNRGAFDQLIYTDNDHGVDVFAGQVQGSFVQQWEVVGDTDGPEAGTRTRLQIITRPITVTTFAC